MNIHQAAQVLGGEVTGPNSLNCPGPGHKSAGDRSLSVKFTPNGVMVHSFAEDDWRDCLNHVQLRLGVLALDNVPWSRHVDVTRAAADTDGTARAWAIWSEAQPIIGTPANLHFKLRGIGDYSGAALRWHPACPFGPGGVRRGCMVAAITNTATGQFQAIQRTPLAVDGEKVGDRMILGPSKGGVIRLSGEAGPHLAIGEGVETALSVQMINGMAEIPVWSTIDANGMTAFPVMEGVQTLWVCVDNDAAGKKAARNVSDVWVNSRRNAYLIMPKEPGLDLNDVLRRSKYA